MKKIFISSHFLWMPLFKIRSRLSQNNVSQGCTKVRMFRKKQNTKPFLKHEKGILMWPSMSSEVMHDFLKICISIIFIEFFIIKICKKNESIRKNLQNSQSHILKTHIAFKLDVKELTLHHFVRTFRYSYFFS